jgi:hypothetical protein
MRTVVAFVVIFPGLVAAACSSSSSGGNSSSSSSSSGGSTSSGGSSSGAGSSSSSSSSGAASSSSSSGAASSSSSSSSGGACGSGTFECGDQGKTCQLASEYCVNKGGAADCFPGGSDPASACTQGAPINGCRCNGDCTTGVTCQ